MLTLWTLPFPFQPPVLPLCPALTLVGHAHAQESSTASSHPIPLQPGLWCSLDLFFHCTIPARVPQGWWFQLWNPALNSSNGTAGFLPCTRQIPFAVRGD